jgi:hypothetical protein
VTDSVAAAEQIWQKFVASVGKKPLSDTTSQDLRDEDADNGGNLGIHPQPYMAAKKNTMGSLPSVMVERPMVANGRMAQVLKDAISLCDGRKPAAESLCEDIQLYNDVTGNHGATTPEGTSVSPGFRSAMFHVISGSNGGWSQERFVGFYSLGNGSYFGESAHDMADFKERYWGPNYGRLLEVKKSVDPENFFWCRNCVGSDL